MNISKEQYEMLCGWLACVEINPNESHLDWAKRAISFRVDSAIVCIEMPRGEFDEACKQSLRKALNSMKTENANQ